MWRLLTVLEFIALHTPQGCTAHCLQFADESMYLVRVEEDSFGGLEQESIAQPEADSIQSLD